MSDRTAGNVETLRGFGCSDGGCVIFRPEGMHTNGGCRCARNGGDPRVLVHALAEYRRELAETRKKLHEAEKDARSARDAQRKAWADISRDDIDL